jgi:hypothetical protein
MGSWWLWGTSRIDAETRKLGQPRDPSINPIPAPQLAASPRVTSTHNPKPTARHPSAEYAPCASATSVPRCGTQNALIWTAGIAIGFQPKFA